MSNFPVQPSTVAKLELKSIMNTNRYSREIANTLVCGVTKYFLRVFGCGLGKASPALVGVGDRRGDVCGALSDEGSHTLLFGWPRMVGVSCCCLAVCHIDRRLLERYNTSTLSYSFTTSGWKICLSNH